MNLNYAIFRSQPIMTIHDLAQIGSHNQREKHAYNSNLDIRVEDSFKNIELVPLNSKYNKGFKEITKQDELFDYVDAPVKTRVKDYDDYDKDYDKSEEFDRVDKNNKNTLDFFFVRVINKKTRKRD